MRLLHWVQLKGGGLLLCLAIAVPAWRLGGQMPLIGGPVFAILAGMLSAPLVRRSSVFKPGIQFSAKKVLQLAVVLPGFGLNLRVIASVGAASLPIILSTILTALAVSALLRRWLRWMERLLFWSASGLQSVAVRPLRRPLGWLSEIPAVSCRRLFDERKCKRGVIGIIS